MATSSFYHNVVIDSDKKAQAFIDALEKSKNQQSPPVQVNCTEPKVLKSFARKIANLK